MTKECFKEYNGAGVSLMESSSASLQANGSFPSAAVEKYWKDVLALTNQIYNQDVSISALNVDYFKNAISSAKNYGSVCGS